MLLAFINPLHTLYLPPAAEEWREDPAHRDGFERRAAGLARLLAEATLVPVTGMDEEALLNVPAAFYSWQVLLYGAVVLNEQGEEDPSWRRLTASTLDERAEALTLAFQAAQHIGQLGQLGTEARLIERAGRPLLVSIVPPLGLSAPLDAAQSALTEWLEEGPFRTHLRLLRENDQLVLLPREITPESAVNYVLSQLDEVDFTLGVSASLGDAAFLALCDSALVPGEGGLLRGTDSDPEPI